ncbi:MAG: hypothetical protein ACJ75G_08615 [Gaiellaceae bacterium]
MVWRWLPVAALVVLLLPAAASAKGVTEVLVVGANGRTVNLGGGWPLYEDLRPQGTFVQQPTGTYLLLYPLMEAGLPMEPGRYYPSARVACWSWSAKDVSDCFAVARLPDTWTRTSRLTAFASEQPRLRSLRWEDMHYTVPSNTSVAVELALARTHAARAAPASPCGWRLHARWQGPAAATRPTSLCLRRKGLSAGGRLYPMPRGVAAMLHAVS